MKRKLHLNHLRWLFMLIGIASIWGCKKYPDPAPFFEDYGADSSTIHQRKILVISVDGVSGSELKTLAPPNIVALESIGKYTYSVGYDDIATDASSWISLMTGVGISKHLISDSSFQYIPGDVGNNENVTIPYFPNVFNYISPVKTDYKIAVVSPWVNLNNYLKIADYDIHVANDQIVKDSAISILNASSPLGVMIVDFNSVELAGNKSEFLATAPDYKAAILKTDSYIGEIISALKARSNYDKEDWLIMVTTNHGGSSENPKPGFLVVSNDKFTKEEIVKRGLSTVNFAYNNVNTPSIYATMNPVVDGNQVYDFDNDFTFEFYGQFDGKSGSYPVCFGNKKQLNGSVDNGFSLFVDPNSTIEFNSTSGAKFQVSTTIPVVDGRWHDIAFTVQKQVDGTRIVSTYIDGVFQAKGNLPSAAKLNSQFPVAVGWQPVTGGNADYIGIRPYGIKFFDKALDSTTIRQTQCLTDLVNHPDYEHLKGYWACDEATGGEMHNSIINSCHFMLHGNFQWIGMGQDVPCPLPVPSLDDASKLSLVVSNNDLVTNMLYWLKIPVNQDWNLDGQSWLNNFEREIYGQ